MTSAHDPSRPLTPRRSVLYVPAANARALAKSRELSADAVVYDLEDAVAPSEKAAAREALRDFFAGERPFRGETVIRINPLASPCGTEDLLAARAMRPDAILLPKVEEPDDVQAVADALAETDAPASLRLWAMIETPRGVLNAAEIARAAWKEGSRLDCFVLGTNDLVKETGVDPVAGRAYLVPWIMQVVLAARSYGLDVLDGVHNDFRDAEGFLAACTAARAMGFDGKTLIHPGQIAGANAAFSPQPEALAQAQAIAAAFARPENAGKGVIQIDGRMVERLHLAMAMKLIARAGALPAAAPAAILDKQKAGS